MAQLEPGRVYQRETASGGGAGKSAGTITVPITLAAPAASIQYRLRDALASGHPVVKGWTTAATGVSASAVSVDCVGISPMPAAISSICAPMAMTSRSRLAPRPS
ncbi:hypothetical protein [Aureimonas populi]|uniref:Uncharacterized protein n=1 Tax=Aureimonas populi TaxID=1701758 RepID=A0ABW5CI82_9HYPH|nr:hypothetical protein [Aureimonas populi]